MYNFTYTMDMDSRKTFCPTGTKSGKVGVDYTYTEQDVLLVIIAWNVTGKENVTISIIKGTAPKGVGLRIKIFSVHCKLKGKTKRYHPSHLKSRKMDGELQSMIFC